MENIKPQSLVAKAKRRIRKFMATGVHQPRTYDAGTNRFLYKVKHHPAVDMFFVLKGNKLYQEKSDGDDKFQA